MHEKRQPGGHCKCVPLDPPKIENVCVLTRCETEWVPATISAPPRFAPALRGRNYGASGAVLCVSLRCRPSECTPLLLSSRAKRGISRSEVAAINQGIPRCVRNNSKLNAQKQALQAAPLRLNGTSASICTRGSRVRRWRLNLLPAKRRSVSGVARPATRPPFE